MNNSEKLVFLNFVNQRKECLFGKLTATVTRDSKLAEWKDIHQHLFASGIQLASQKSATYFRDTVWPDLKRYTIEKKEKRHQTGAAGDLKVKWTTLS